MPSRGAIKIVSVNGALTVTLTGPAGNTPTVYSDDALTTTVSLPATVNSGATSTFYVGSPGTYQLSIKTSTGTEIAGDANTTRPVDLSTGEVQTFSYDTRLLTRVSESTGRSTVSTGASIPVTNYKVVTASGDTTGATDLAALQAAINAVNAGGGGIVDVVGTCWVNATVVPKAGVHLRGQGWFASSINLASGANCTVIAPGATYYNAKITDIAIDGWKENQSAGSWRGIDLSGVGTRGGAPNTAYLGGQGIVLKNVLVRSTKSSGFYIDVSGAVETRLTDCYTYGCDSDAYYLGGSDIFVLNCTAGGQLGHGFTTNGLGVRLNNCKAWQSGWSWSRTFTSTYPTGGDTTKHGFNVVGQNCTLVACEAQDNAGVGLNMGGDCCQAFGFNADANLTAAYQLYINARHCVIEGIIGNGTSHGTPSAYALSIWDSSAVGNKVRITWPNNTGGVTAGMAAGSLSKVPQNDIIIGTPDAQYPVGYQSTLTPDPFYGSPFMTLAGNVTVANPPADRYIPGKGAGFRVTLVQDATGSRTVTWGSDYIVTTALAATASQATSWEFECMNGKWVERGKAGLVGVTVPNTAPGQVGTVTATPGNAQVALSWSAPNNGGSAITDYTVQYRTTSGPGAWQTFSHTASTATTQAVTGLTNNTSYDFQVAAVNAIGQGAYSAFVTATPVNITTYVSDSFDRANSATSLGTADSGQTWTVSAGGGPWGITGNLAYCPGADFSQAVIDSTVSDCTIRCTFSSAARAALVMRWADSNNNLSVTATSLGGTVGGAGLGNLATWTAFNDGDVITVVLAGGTVTVKQNGTTVGTSSAASMAPLQTNTKHGLQARGDALGRWNDYSVKSA